MRRLSTLLLLLTLFGLTGAGAAQTPQTDKDKAAAQQQKAMEAMMRAATPGEAHKKLNVMAGTFDAKIKMWDAPGTKPNESSGKSVNEWVLGGRWLQQRFEGTFMNMPFSGIGYTGYDNIKQMYIGTWMDSMSTSVMMSSGQPDAADKVWTFAGSMDDPLSGESSQVTSKLTVVDNDHHLFEMWAPGPDGRMYKMMEIAYTRKK